MSGKAGSGARTKKAGSGATTVTAYPDGPYLLRGEFTLRDELGEQIGTSHRVVALCRCGASRLRPFCDGTHRAIGFRAPGSGRGSDAAGAEEEGSADEVDPFALRAGTGRS